MKTLSVIIPAYNEERTVNEIISKVGNVKFIENLNLEIVVINDASSDKTVEVVKSAIKQNTELNIQLYNHEKNQGKGAAIHTGISKSKGDFIVVQDADLEYDPDEFNILLKPLLDGYADVVYGSRFMGGKPHRILFFWHTMGNKFLTFLSNMFTNLNLTDMETCYKLFKADILKSIPLKEKRFGFEPEVTAKMSRVKGIRVYEVGISYYGRTYEEGKKINWKDGFRAIYCILRYNLLK